MKQQFMQQELRTSFSPGGVIVLIRFRPWFVKFGVAAAIVLCPLLFAEGQTGETDSRAVTAYASPSPKQETATASALPNLAPYRPAGWSGPIVVTKTTSSTVDATNISASDSLFLDFSVINNGSASTVPTGGGGGSGGGGSSGGGSGDGSFDVDLYLDGVLKVAWSTHFLPLNAGLYEYPLPIAIGSLTAGTHSISMAIDPGHVITESSESDNSFSRSLTVESSQQALPNLTPFQPAGWSSPVVLSRTRGSTVDSPNLSAGDSLYLDWAVQNKGIAAVNSPFSTSVYLDGRVIDSWSGVTSTPLAQGYYAYRTDVSIGKLPPGQHTLKLVADATNAIPEGNETDNTFTKTVEVSGVPCDRTMNPRCGVRIIVPSPPPPRR